MVVEKKFVVSGVVSRTVHIRNHIINESNEFTKEEVENLAAPLLDIVQHLTYKVTEIALDRPGIKLGFRN